MTSYCFRYLLLLVPFALHAQAWDQVIVQPGLTLSYQDEVRWSYVTSLQQRSMADPEVEGLHLQLTQFVNYEVGFYSSIGMGVMYRELFDHRSPEEVRLTQQWVNKRKYNSLKVAHRLRADQRFRGKRTTLRWRYRFSIAAPLNGSVLDPSEFYLNANAESLMVNESGRSSVLDQRISLGIGRQLTSDIKLQLNAEHRWESWTKEVQKGLFLHLTMYLKL